ncbi:MAG: hypothetical protein A2W93_01240 [Bacteroidetes bacterium GWF2_43_63]|nr:MAG: hypothetical protein A2W94_10830 [Bacteroidetes bacterium GWE2_42_42]OFY55703.1 MAG: hypothetical protein A2W93_01240 [Bacteroidetes bacterium GWF2_43_63]HBG69490.1 four helix bundle protein [Bacteroidales bacterium]HCB61343.1 four helix bundle protein [Bacteroidales bacterium]HCY24218.1 four helix bundle protein [Bacteroidales bacterium]
MKQVFDLEERMANYSALVLSFCDSIQKTYAGSTIANQLTRSGISVALNYAEAQSAESRKDFVHKMKISLKESRESYMCLRIISKSSLQKSDEMLLNLLKETNELISILVKSIETAKRNLENGNK